MRVKITLVVIVICLAFILAVACAGSYATEDASFYGSTEYQKVAGPPSGYGLFRVEDVEKDVTCWIGEGSYRAGIFCIPNWQLKPTVDDGK